MSEAPIPIGENSRLYVVYPYCFPGWETGAGTVGRSARVTGWVQAIEAAGWFKQDKIPLSEVLPHLDEHIAGKRALASTAGPETVTDPLLVRFSHSEKLGGFVASGQVIRLFDTKGRDKDAIHAQLLGPPEIYLFESGLVFIGIELGPVVPTLDAFMALQLALVRRGHDNLQPGSFAQASRLEQVLGNPGRDATWRLRDALGALVPGLDQDAPPRGSRPAPYALSTLYAPDGLSPVDVHKLRLFHGPRQAIVPSPEDSAVSDHPCMLHPSAEETWLFSAFGAVLYVRAVEPASALRAAMHVRVRQSYAFMWLLTQHLRTQLLDLSTRCAKFEPHDQNFRAEVASLQGRLLEIAARHSFSLLSDEARHQRFYARARALADIETLQHEVLDEVGRIREYLEVRQQLLDAETQKAAAAAADEAAHNADQLNRVLALLTFVFTPAGLVIGIFQGETLPPVVAQWCAGRAGWMGAITHLPLWLTGAAMAIGYWGFRRFRRK
ncbi:MAG: hypothetical protein H6716_27200 [Polyangiaceae bacterium]|nr:hypothetical protein [Polyangiaceae bacterium]